MRAPRGGGSVENVVERQQGGTIESVELNAVLAKDLDPLERTAR